MSRRFVAFSIFVGLGLILVGGRSLIVADASPLVPRAVLVPTFVLGLWLPLGVLLYAMRRQRVAVVALAFCVGLSANVVFLANAVPANAATDNTSQFWLNTCCTQTFACPGGIYDMYQSSALVTSNTTRGGGAGVSYTYCSDTFTSSQSLQANTTTANFYMGNGSSSKTCDFTGELLWYHAASSTTTSLGLSATQTIPTNTPGTSPMTFNWATSAVGGFADGDRLYFTLAFTSTASNCNSSQLNTGAVYPSNFTTATIVSEIVVGFLLLAPALPLAARWWKRRRP